jgi:predicted HicB family RNase H-like nuclease
MAEVKRFATLYFKDPKLRKRAVKEAQRRGMSFSAWVVSLIRKAVGA